MEGEIDDLIEAERHAAGIGPLALLIAYGRVFDPVLAAGWRT